MPRECLSQLACDPFGRRMLCNADPDELPPVQPDDDEGIEQVETNARDNEQVHGSNVRRVVAQEGVPSLTRRSMPLGHVFGHRRLGDVKAKLKKLAVNARRSPQRVRDIHSPDQCAQFRSDLRRPPRERDFQRQ